MAAALVANRDLFVVGDFGELLHEIIDVESRKFVVFECSIQVVDIGLVVARMVDFHSHGIEVGFEGIVAVAQRRKGVSHCCVIGCRCDTTWKNSQYVSVIGRTARRPTSEI